MFAFLRRIKPTTIELKPSDSCGQVLYFDPGRIVKGITFHLLDEGKAHDVNPESSLEAVTKLSQRIDKLAIPAETWASMENRQRLQWLLEQSHIVVRPAPTGSVTLAVR